MKEIRLADFGAIDIADFSASDATLALFHLGHRIRREISLPITPEDRHKYCVTQLLADLVRRQGFDGIRFPSSVASGSNICVFQRNLFASEAARGKVIYVIGLKFEIADLESVVELGAFSSISKLRRTMGIRIPIPPPAPVFRVSRAGVLTPEIPFPNPL